MFLINWVVAIAALGIAGLIFAYIGRCIEVEKSNRGGEKGEQAAAKV